MEKMFAAVMHGPGDIRYEEVDKPECPSDGLILKIMAVGLCGSDIRNLTTDSRKGDYPFIYGHEIVGIVDEIGPEETKYKVGDRLYLFPGTYCMECDSCVSGHSENCENEHVSRLAGTGGFAQYIAVGGEKIHYGGIYEIPEGIKFEAASLGEPMTSVYACLENIEVGFRDTVVIIGAGPIGCFMTRIAKLRGAKTVILIDINQLRLDQGTTFGADYLINSANEDPVAAVRKITGGKGADKVISANPSTATQQPALEMVKKGGIVVFFGGVPKGAMTELDTNLIHYSNIWVKGHFGASYIQSKNAFNLAISPEFAADDFISYRLPLSEINQGIELTRKDAIKVVLFPNGMNPDGE